MSNSKKVNEKWSKKDYQKSSKRVYSRSDKAITLIALVITIIILLILAGITISQLSNSGLFEKARSAEENYQLAQEDENMKLAGYEDEMAKYIQSGRGDVLQYESTKIANFTPTVSSDGNDIKISIEPLEAAKGYAYFVDDKVKAISGNSSETIEVNEVKKYKIYAVAIDEDFKFKKSTEVNITTAGSESIFNGQSTDTAKTGGFNVSLSASNNWTTYYYTNDITKPSLYLQAAFSGTYGVAISKNKINLSEISSLTYEVSGNSDHNSLNCNVYVGIAETNTVNTTFLRSDKVEGEKQFNNRKLKIDVSDLTEEYYLKCELYHPTNISDQTVWMWLYNIVANKKGTVE